MLGVIKIFQLYAGLSSTKESFHIGGGFGEDRGAVPLSVLESDGGQDLTSLSRQPLCA